MMSLSFLHKALQHYLSEHATHYNEQRRIWSAHTQTYTHFDEQTLVALFTPFPQPLTLSVLAEHQSDFWIEHHNAAPYTLRLLLADTSFSQQVGMMLASQAAINAYRHITGSLPVNVQWVVSRANKKGNGTFVTLPSASLGSPIAPIASVSSAHACLWDASDWPDFAAYETPVMALGCKGQLDVAFEVQAAWQVHMVQALPSSYGAIVPDAAWRLLWALNSLKDAREEILIDGFYDTLLSPEDDEIALLHTLPAITQSMEQHWGVKALLSGLGEFQLQYVHFLTPTCTVTSISSGERGKNEMPIGGRAEVNFQLLPGQEPEDIFAKLRRHLDTNGFQDVETHLLSAHAPIKTPLADAFVQWVQAATHMAYGKQPVVLPLVSRARLEHGRGQEDMPTVIVASDYAKQTGVQQEQQFMAMAMQIALLIAHIASAKERE